MASYYPVDDDETEDMVRVTVSFPKSVADELQLVADLWNEFDSELAPKRREKWLVARVVRRFVNVGLDAFWDQVGGRLPSKEGREEFVKRAVEKLRRGRGKKQS